MATTGNRTTTPVARTNPAVRGPESSTSSGVLAWYAAIGKDARAGASSLDGYAPNIQKGILKASTLPHWVNRQIAARRQRLLILRMARAYEALARASEAAQAAWRGDLGEPGSVDKVRSGIDMSK